jgi:hypothetical protein
MASALVNKKTLYQNPEEFFAGINSMRTDRARNSGNASNWSDTNSLNGSSGMMQQSTIKICIQADWQIFLSVWGNELAIPVRAPLQLQNYGRKVS